MKQSQILGTMIPTIPEYQSIIQQLQDKYGLAEISPDDEPITEIYLDDRIVPLEEFRQEVQTLVEKNSDFLFDDSKLWDIYKKFKPTLGKPLMLKGYEKLLPKKTKQAIHDIYNLSQKITELVVTVLDQQFRAIADIIYIYLLTGESIEAPQDWFSVVGKTEIDGNPVVFAMASQLSDPNIVVQQFREQYKKNFGVHQPKVTDTMVKTAHYMRLKKMGKSWEYIIREYIRLNKIRLPRDTTSPRYFRAYTKVQQRVMQRVKRTTTILKVIGRDIK